MTLTKKIICCETMRALEPHSDYQYLTEQDVPQGSFYFMDQITEPGFYFYLASESELVLSNKPFNWCPWCGAPVSFYIQK